jgi:glycosyltransferase involved in cell wall biosynthesis
MPDLSVLIPARNEIFLARTIQDILSNIGGDTEIIAVCDGGWAEPPIDDHPKVHLIYHSQAIGQRAATNEAARLSRAKFIMKADAHCSFDKDFDVKMMADCEPNWTATPRQYNLHVFDWVCKCGHRIYQGPTPEKCPDCGGKMEKEMLWEPRARTHSDSMTFDSNLHFQYWREYSHRPGMRKAEIVETMSILGACWMMHRDRYWELGGMDEGHGSWGQMGTEVACKTWLSGGRLIVNKKTWFAHLFRTQGGDFGFPYPNTGTSQARKYSCDLWLGNKWPKAIHPLSWLIEKFAPVPTWGEKELEGIRTVCDDGEIRENKEEAPEEEEVEIAIKPNSSPIVSPRIEVIPHIVVAPIPLPSVVTIKPTKGLCYYTDNRLDQTILDAVRTRLKISMNGHRLVSVSLRPPGFDFGESIILNIRRGYLTMAKQQLLGLERLGTDIAFMVEHDILYPVCHFEFTPPKKDVFYYNLNWWKVRTSDGQALHFKAKQVSGCCAYTEILIEYFRNRVRMIESGEIGGRRHFEPGGHHRDAYDKLTTHGFDTWSSEVPYVDIRHDTVLTRNIFDPSGYRGQVTDWTMADEIPHWGKTKGRFNEFLKEAMNAL